MSVIVSVVIATYNRQRLLTRLLDQLSVQTLQPELFEVVVVDDGSEEPVSPLLEATPYPYALRVLTCLNAGAAAARHRGIEAAKGKLLVITDDDMQVPPEFLATHLAQHPPGSRRAVLGRIRADPQVRDMPLFERWYAYRLDKVGDQLEAGRVINGSVLYTGNLSLRRADYLEVGGFDVTLKRSEDAELGLRLEASGVQLGFCSAAYSLHGSDHTSEARWLRAAFQYGVSDSQIRAKHPTLVHADPWRFLFKLPAPTRPLFAAVVLAPNATKAWSKALIALTHACDTLGFTRAAYAGSAVAYTMEYFRGVRTITGSLSETADSFAHHLELRRAHRKGGSHVARVPR